jgi:hypothetical protein
MDNDHKIIEVVLQWVSLQPTVFAVALVSAHARRLAAAS